jgi:hypothetical protein
MNKRFQKEFYSVLELSQIKTEWNTPFLIIECLSFIRHSN